jgi:hypothetical protein
MKYENAKDILPEDILRQIQKYAAGKLLYVPIENESRSWGESSGYRQKLLKRNLMICNKYANGMTISELADEYYLSLDSIKKIIYCKKNKSLEFSNSLTSAIQYANVGMEEEWIQTYLEFYTNCDRIDGLLKEEAIYFGVVKIPLRLIGLDNMRLNRKNFANEKMDTDNIESEKTNRDYIDNERIDCEKLVNIYGNTTKETEPLIVRFEHSKFFVDVQHDMLLALKKRKINAYPAFILIKKREEYKTFMKNYGNHFIRINKI